MARITVELLMRALDCGPLAARTFGWGRPCLEPNPISGRFILHRHREGARKVRRILRRQQQREAATQRACPAAVMWFDEVA